MFHRQKHEQQESFTNTKCNKNYQDDVPFKDTEFIEWSENFISALTTPKPDGSLLMDVLKIPAAQIDKLKETRKVYVEQLELKKQALAEDAKIADEMEKALQKIVAQFYEIYGTTISANRAAN